jgi:hypothetical protein
LSISGKLFRTASRSTVHSLENDEIGLFARYETSSQADLLPLTQRKGLDVGAHHPLVHLVLLLLQLFTQGFTSDTMRVEDRIQVELVEDRFTLRPRECFDDTGITSFVRSGSAQSDVVTEGQKMLAILLKASRGPSMKLAVVEVLRWYVVDQESSTVIIEADQNFEQGGLAYNGNVACQNGSAQRWRQINSPDPLYPTIARDSPGSIVRLMFFSVGVLSPGYLKVRF